MKYKVEPQQTTAANTNATNDVISRWPKWKQALGKIIFNHID